MSETAMGETTTAQAEIAVANLAPTPRSPSQFGASTLAAIASSRKPAPAKSA
jgi:hypothetical protein